MKNARAKVIALMGFLMLLSDKLTMKLKDGKEFFFDHASGVFESNSVVFSVDENGERSLLSEGDYETESGAKFTVNGQGVATLLADDGDGGDGDDNKREEDDDANKAELKKQEETVAKIVAELGKQMEGKDDGNAAIKALVAELSKKQDVTPIIAQLSQIEKDVDAPDRMIPTELKKDARKVDVALSVISHIHAFLGKDPSVEAGKRLRVKMASAEPTITTNFTGEAAAGYIGALFLPAPTLRNGNIEIHENVSSKYHLGLIDVNNLIKAETCEFNHQGTVNLTERTLEPIGLEINFDFCKNKFRQNYEALIAGMKGSAHGKMPSVFLNKFISEISAYASAQVEREIWDSNSGIGNNTLLTKGILKHLIDDAAPANNLGAWTQANDIVDVLRALFDALPQEVQESDDLTYFLPTNASTKWMRKISDNGVNVNYNENAFDGIRVVKAPGVKVPILSPASNFHFGTDLMSDENVVKILDLENTTGDDVIRAIWKFRADVNVARPDLASFYSSLL